MSHVFLFFLSEMNVFFFTAMVSIECSDESARTVRAFAVCIYEVCNLMMAQAKYKAFCDISTTILSPGPFMKLEHVA